MDSCGMSLVKFLLFGFNIIFCITGLILIVLGGIVLSEATYTTDFNESATYVPSIIIIVVGIVVFAIAFLGCYGAIRESYAMLMTFAVFLLLIFIVELAIGIAVAANGDQLQSADLKNTFNDEKYKSKWDIIQKGLKCCGVDGPTDWGGSIPESCCVASATGNEGPNAQCQGFNKDMNYLSNRGCFQIIQNNFNTGKKVLTGIGIGIAFVEIVGIVLACWLATVIRREKSDDPKD